MSHPENPPVRPTMEMRVPHVQFLREQDGVAELLLKNRLIECFKHLGNVQRAYLAQVSMGNQLGVALCLRNMSGLDKKLVETVGAEFAAIFNAREHLDIIFLTDEQEATLVAVCKQFLGRSLSNS